MRLPAIALACLFVLSGCLFASPDQPKGDGDAGTEDTGVDCLQHSTHDGTCYTLCRDVDPDCPYCDVACDDHETEVASCDDATTSCRTLHACGLTVYCAEKPTCEPTCRKGWNKVAACPPDRLCETQTSCGQEIACERLHCGNPCEDGYVEVGDSCAGLNDCHLESAFECDWEVACAKVECEPECPEHWTLADNCEGDKRCKISEICDGSVACKFACNLACPENHVEHHTCQNNMCVRETACGLTIYCLLKATCSNLDATPCPDHFELCATDNLAGCQPFYACGDLVHCRANE